MKRNYGIWYAIAVIMVIGVVTTSYTNKLVKSQQTVDTASTASAQEAVALSEEEDSEENTAKQDVQVMAGRAAALPSEETAVSQETVQSPLSPAETVPEQKAAIAAYGAGAQDSTEITGYQQYETRLAELDAQIKRMRDEETNSTTNAMKTTAEAELKLWDTELNLLYNTIMDDLDKEEASQLIQQERAWMKDRDALAVTAAKKFGGGTMEGLEYTASLADSTRKRVYELAASYKDVLDK